MPLLLLLILLLPASTLPATERRTGETLIERELRRIVEEERAVWAAFERAGEGAAEDFRARFQQLVSAYDLFIRTFPDFPAGYVAYGLFLRKVDEPGAAAAMFLKANELDPNIAVVKNQLGNYVAEEGRPLDALPYFLAAVELDIEEPLYHYQVGSLLHEARNSFLESGHFTRDVLDRQMLEAFRQARDRAPNVTAYAYRYAEAYYDLEDPRWDEALALWQRLEDRVEPGLERQTILLHQANVLIKLDRTDEAAETLADVTEPMLASNKKTLIDQLPPAGKD